MDEKSSWKGSLIPVPPCTDEDEPFIFSIFSNILNINLGRIEGNISNLLLFSSSRLL